MLPALDGKCAGSPRRKFVYLVALVAVGRIIIVSRCIAVAVARPRPFDVDVDDHAPKIGPAQPDEVGKVRAIARIAAGRDAPDGEAAVATRFDAADSKHPSAPIRAATVGTGPVATVAAVAA